MTELNVCCLVKKAAKEVGRYIHTVHKIDLQGEKEREREREKKSVRKREKDRERERDSTIASI